MKDQLKLSWKASPSPLHLDAVRVGGNFVEKMNRTTPKRNITRRHEAHTSVCSVHHKSNTQRQHPAFGSELKLCSGRGLHKTRTGTRMTRLPWNRCGTIQQGTPLCIFRRCSVSEDEAVPDLCNHTEGGEPKDPPTPFGSEL